MPLDWPLLALISMPVTFSAASPDRQGDVLSFLAGVFRITEIPLHLRHDALCWKFFDPHPWWPGSRCYLLETEHGIAAHASIAPTRYLNGDAEIESGVFLDWASGGPLPGAGMLILRRLFESAVPTVLGVGGTEDNLRVITRLKWFERKEDVRGMCARSMRGGAGHAPRRHLAKSPVSAETCSGSSARRCPAAVHGPAARPGPASLCVSPTPAHMCPSSAPANGSITFFAARSGPRDS